MTYHIYDMKYIMTYLALNKPTSIKRRGALYGESFTWGVSGDRLSHSTGEAYCVHRVPKVEQIITRVILFSFGWDRHKFSYKIFYMGEVDSNRGFLERGGEIEDLQYIIHQTLNPRKLRSSLSSEVKLVSLITSKTTSREGGTMLLAGTLFKHKYDAQK